MADYSAQGLGGRGGGQGSSPGQRTSGGGGGGGAKQALRPLTIKMLVDAQHVGDGNLVVDGFECGQIAVMGRIVAIDNTVNSAAGQSVAKSIAYKITDGSGVLSVRKWFDQGESLEPLALGNFIHAVGLVRIMSEQPVISATNVRVVEDINELTYHLLDCIMTHLRLTQGESNVKPTGGRQTGGATAAATAGPAMAMGGGGAADVEKIVLRVLMGVKDRSIGSSAVEMFNSVRLNLPSVDEHAFRAVLDGMAAKGELTKLSNGNYSY